jgi:hypothetical protein
VVAYPFLRAGSEGRVTAIHAPPLAETDRGVGVGSGLDQVRQAYRGVPVSDVESQAGQVLLVEGDASWLGFNDRDYDGRVDGITVSADADVASGFEVCSDVPPAGTGLVSFVTPTGNISCYVNGDPDAPEARCDILEREWSAPPRPASCQLDWGGALVVDEDDAHFLCVGDSAYNENVVPYGTSIRSGSLQCDVDENGVTCQNTSTDHGFVISRATFSLF